MSRPVVPVKLWHSGFPHRGGCALLETDLEHIHIEVAGTPVRAGGAVVCHGCEMARLEMISASGVLVVVHSDARQPVEEALVMALRAVMAEEDSESDSLDVTVAEGIAFGCSKPKGKRHAGH
jgi:hypothetical protein